MGARPPSTAGGRVLGSTQPRPPARFSSLRSQEIVNHKQEPWGNTLLAQRYPISGNSYFWRTAKERLAPASANSTRQVLEVLLPPVGAAGFAVVSAGRTLAPPELPDSFSF